jgi:FlaA1/EpsC-like NDP-sugar epimerase
LYINVKSPTKRQAKETNEIRNMSFADRVSDFSERLTHFVSRNQDAVRLTLTVVATSALTATSILGFQAVKRRRKVKSIKEEVAAAPIHSTQLTSYGTLQLNENNFGKNLPQRLEFEESLIHEQLSRNIAFLGEENVQKLRKSFVIVVGAGGVGSWAALMLLRSGVERIRIIDFDQVTLSSLNRHAVATQADVGTPKVKAIEKHFKRIVPHAIIDARIELFSAENASELLEGWLAGWSCI